MEQHLPNISNNAAAYPVTVRQDATSKIAAQLRSGVESNKAARCLLVVDPSRRALMDRPDIGVFFSRQTPVLIPIQHEAFPLAHRPFLIELDLSDKDGVALLTESIRIAFEDREPDLIARGHGQRIGGWLISEASAEDVAAHLSRNALLTDEHGSACLLRFYDTRALALLWPVLTVSQQKTLLGPSVAWHALNACASQCVYTCNAIPQVSLGLTHEQWKSIRRHSVINKALGRQMHEIERQPRPDEVETAQASAERAEQHGLFDDDDKVAFIRHALSWHPNFDAHASVRRALSQVSTGSFYAAAVSELTSAEIDEIRSGAEGA
ncbi:DUF4123 domain-containing protein [Burkholderia sp. S171]|uniref:DUF4123 domain-containing protein n=1 Tax=Burkholderia sp. S171 TaxID=1641860 RepID=UPI00131D2E9E|nr:DUF4123 domain-containing protein [Burkholderia sp. S171]